MRESTLEARFVAACRRVGLLCPKGSMLGNGYPDRLVIGPRGQVVWVELKAPGGRLRDSQKLVIRQLRDRGHVVFVPRSFADCQDAMKAAFGVTI